MENYATDNYREYICAKKMKLIGKFKNLMVAGIGADNRKVGNIVETWYIYKKGDIG